jgi:hypothetical protein
MAFNTISLPLYAGPSILRQKKNHANSNISPCKNIIFLKTLRLEKTGLITGCKDRLIDVLLPMFCAGQDACLDFVITHLLHPTFIDRVIGKSLIVAKAAIVKKHSNDDEKCHRNGLRLIAMTWETFDGSTLETRIMIRKIATRHADKHNRPRGQTIYQINQCLFIALQRGVGEQLIACECAG